MLSQIMYGDVRVVCLIWVRFTSITRCIMVDSGAAAGGATQAPSVAQGDIGLSPHLLAHEIRDK